jgi:hypothetical protein
MLMNMHIGEFSNLNKTKTIALSTLKLSALTLLPHQTYMFKRFSNCEQGFCV